MEEEQTKVTDFPPSQQETTTFPRHFMEIFVLTYSNENVTHFPPSNCVLLGFIKHVAHARDMYMTTHQTDLKYREHPRDPDCLVEVGV